MNLPVLKIAICWFFSICFQSGLLSQAIPNQKNFNYLINNLLDKNIDYNEKEKIINQIVTSFSPSAVAVVKADNGMKMDIFELEEFLYRLLFLEYGRIEEFQIKVISSEKVVLKYNKNIFENESPSKKLHLNLPDIKYEYIGIGTGAILATIASIKLSKAQKIETDYNTLSDAEFLEKYPKYGTAEEGLADANRKERNGELLLVGAVLSSAGGLITSFLNKDRSNGMIGLNAKDKPQYITFECTLNQISIIHKF